MNDKKNDVKNSIGAVQVRVKEALKDLMLKQQSLAKVDLGSNATASLAVVEVFAQVLGEQVGMAPDPVLVESLALARYYRGKAAGVAANTTLEAGTLGKLLGALGSLGAHPGEDSDQARRN